MKQSELAKIHFILEQIDRIERIIRRHSGVVAAMEDFEGEMALLMGIAQIGETLTNSTAVPSKPSISLKIATALITRETRSYMTTKMLTGC